MGVVFSFILTIIIYDDDDDDKLSVCNTVYYGMVASFPLAILCYLISHV